MKSTHCYHHNHIFYYIDHYPIFDLDTLDANIYSDGFKSTKHIQYHIDNDLHYKNLYVRQEKVGNKYIYHHYIRHEHYRHRYISNSDEKIIEESLSIKYHSKNGRPFNYRKNSRHYENGEYHYIDTGKSLNRLLLDQYDNFTKGSSSIINDQSNEYATYDLKHFKINIFFKIWRIYKNIVNPSFKPLFLEYILPYFTKLNWTTVSRLYDPNDEEFVRYFSDFINLEFARDYNPLLKKMI